MAGVSTAIGCELSAPCGYPLDELVENEIAIVAQLCELYSKLYRVVYWQSRLQLRFSNFA